jgi:hypothetical protein
LRCLSMAASGIDIQDVDSLIRRRVA